jgi:protein required for attachment to host cells
MNLQDKTSILIASGEIAKLFRANGNGENYSLEHVKDLVPGHLADDGPAGKSPPDESDKELNEATFSKHLANYLYHSVHSGKIKSLVLVADPDSLGEIRPLLHKEVENVLKVDLAKTLINSPVDDIEKALKAA